MNQAWFLVLFGDELRAECASLVPLMIERAPAPQCWCFSNLEYLELTRRVIRLAKILSRKCSFFDTNSFPSKVTRTQHVACPDDRAGSRSLSTWIGVTSSLASKCYLRLSNGCCDAVDDYVFVRSLMLLDMLQHAASREQVWEFFEKLGQGTRNRTTSE